MAEEAVERTGVCPVCGETRPLVTVMWIEKYYTDLWHVCELCRLEWLKRVKMEAVVK